MKVSPGHLAILREAIEPLDTEERRALYRARDPRIPRIDLAQDIDKRRVLQYEVHDEYLGRAYTVDVPGGQRTYYFQHISEFE